MSCGKVGWRCSVAFLLVYLVSSNVLSTIRKKPLKRGKTHAVRRNKSRWNEQFVRLLFLSPSFHNVIASFSWLNQLSCYPLHIILPQHLKLPFHFTIRSTACNNNTFSTTAVKNVETIFNDTLIVLRVLKFF